MNRIKYTFLTIITMLFALAVSPSSVHASAASLSLSPDSASQVLGSNFTVNVNVNSGGNAINAIEATINMPGNILTVTGASSGGSLCSLWVQQPTVSGSSVSFKCGIPNGTTSSGKLISISLNASNTGTGTASISGVKILAGPGTNVTGGATGGTYTVKKPVYATPSPTVSSGTHPDQNAWYKNNSPSFSWSSGSGFSYVFDQNAGTVPAASVNTRETSVSFKDKADGIWYFHIRAEGSSGWSGTTTYRVQIDTGVPTDLVIVTEPKDEASKRPMVSFVAKDAASGIDYYEIRMDREDFVRATSPFTPSSINSGLHVFTVRAYDKAGNMIEGSVKIKIAEIAVPEILSPNDGATLKLAQQMEISGTAAVGTKVNVYLDGMKIAVDLEVKDDGTWSYTYKTLIMPGKHQIFAIATSDGIESQYSKKIDLRIDPAAISLFGLVIPSFVIFVVVALIILGLCSIIFWLFFFVKRRYDKVREKFKKRNKEAKVAVNKELEKMETKINKDIEVTLENIAPPIAKIGENELEEHIRGDVKTTEKKIDEKISEEVKDL